MSRSVLSRNAVGAGLAALIPLPWVDEAVRRRLLRHSFEVVAAEAGVALHAEALDVLVEDRGGFLPGCLAAIVLWPMKKLFRTVIYVLTLKDVADWMADAALRAEMVRIAAAQGELPARAARVRTLMDEMLKENAVSPVTRRLRRAPQPPVDWPPGSDVLVGGVGWLLREAGGGFVLPAFSARLGEAVAEPLGQGSAV